MSNYPQINIRLRQGADSTHKGPVTRKMFPFDDGIMTRSNAGGGGGGVLFGRLYPMLNIRYMDDNHQVLL